MIGGEPSLFQSLLEHGKLSIARQLQADGWWMMTSCLMADS